MTDRELLELAAKAAGHEIVYCRLELGGCLMKNPARWWNPLDDDGDALRLAVKLRLVIGNHDKYTEVCHTLIFGGDDDTPEDSVVFHDEVSGDPYAATRLAIVRAAAEVGRAMG